MHSKSLLVAAFAAAAAATPLGTGSSWQSSSSSSAPPYPTSTGGYSMTTSYYSSAPTGYSSAASYSSGGKYSAGGSWGSSSTVLGNPTASPNPVPTAGTVGKLLTEDTRVARFKEIQSEIAAGNLALKFDFNPAANPAVTAGKGGQVDLANRATFPVLTDLGISAAGIFFQPCGLNTPHIHPDATEFFTVATNNNITTGFVLENGLATEFSTSLTQFQGTVFPMGSIHWQQNNDCTPAVAIAGLNSEDPGASSIAQNFLINTDSAIVDATLGFPKQIDSSNFAQFKANIPPPLALGVEECLIRCKINY
ncbi:uncharacterized protein Z519_10810 [Cladophialophora bantiana CBS 173.52]|uniref:Cupin type-1 domain-containing protein n=1 Tax=Cladophialophora bantiana (strain ATCC 10958 / CBS 173.52 / CDC B-1940 / NIH 8579) TaxID=1442370 RepID=A0A0D2H604_CLAB1|nr:uncharacterized protein Z519_10810 [Cladophialophora bantiana CBS 173.52]KIW88763.1 hypothetical protein Z519_10810 [Cladophialophora bantiana CBS 173.52]